MNFSIERRRQKLIANAEMIAGSLKNGMVSGLRGLFLPTTFRRLANESEALPRRVILGRHGSGKSFISYQMLRWQKWREFWRAAGVTVATDALFYPLRISRQIEGESYSDVCFSAMEVRQCLGGKTNSFGAHKAATYLQQSLNDLTTLGQWRSCWLEVLARRLSLPWHGPGSFADSIQDCPPIVVLIDALEELFPDYAHSANQKMAIAALLSLPDWFEERDIRNCGLLIFVRPRLVTSAVSGRAGAALVERSLNHDLTWSRADIMRFAAWICLQGIDAAEILPGVTLASLNNATWEDLRNILLPLWGNRLGGQHGDLKSLDWALQATKDQTGRYNPATMVQRLQEWTTASLGDTVWTDRLLTPQAMG